ncbi:hypothetical protein [Yoonia sediminilitoris]|uniref:Uncharacterized protein n=1 Tax=Yoonia sediminilitoris TaxID=1286148 RepID=A0A2T6KMI9_9RHOB|nr:hypothetical protein [Yoonia sediminilitoris]PUB17391.1 hypothetical protein C8N45_102403 [Yoonia sediminilitoris]RCW97686.1 hypothetical protein DFP92_102403 [Yoonia sediminilitoris]
MTYLLRQAMAVLLFVLVPGLVMANCDLLRTAEIPADQLAQVRPIQSGLRTAMQDDNALLQDGKFGAYTRVTLVQFCMAYPLPDDVDTLTGTLTAARDYDVLTRLRRDWYDQTSVPAFADKLLEIAPDGLNLTTLSLAGPRRMTAAILNGDSPSTQHCADLRPQDLPSDAQTAVQTFSMIDPVRWPDVPAICSSLAAPQGKDGTIAALTRFGKLEQALSSSLRQVMSPDFTLWLGEAIETRGPRLAGNADIVRALVTEYRAENRAGMQRDFSPIYDRPFPACGNSGETGIIAFTAFDQRLFDSLTAPVDVLTLLEPLGEQTFSSRPALRNAVLRTLDGQINACLHEQISAALDDDQNFGEFYTLNPELAENLALVEDFADAAPVLPMLIGKTAPSQDALLSGVRSMIQIATQERIMAEVELAAETLAAAAEPVEPVFDNLPVGLEDQIEPLDLNPTIGVTEATDSAILATVADPEFQKALLATTYQPAPNAEVLKGNVRDVLSPIAAQKVVTSVNRDMARLLSAVENPWALTADLRSAIQAAPAVTSINVNPDLVAVMENLADLEYPNTRLFETAVNAAVDNLGLDKTETPVTDIRILAERTAPALNAPRISHVALPDCGCVRLREGNKLIYGFYPFWKAPLASATTTVDSDEVQAEQTYLIDFGLVGRAAFYGVEIVTDEEASADSTRVSLRNDGFWQERGWDFINAAHQHRAKADLAIRLNGWQTWEEKDISAASQQITALLQPFRGISDYAWSQTPRPYESLIDGLWGGWQVDGLTLEVPGYDGSSAVTPNIGNIVTLVTQIKSSRIGERIDVNLAFDLNLDPKFQNVPLFGEIRELLVGGRNRDVEHVLVSLQQPTTDSKKQLRLRMDLGGARGAQRAEILDNILPVLPGGGHREIRTSPTPPSTVPGVEFSQFADDLVYFHQNFGGVGFWPIPDPTNDDTPEMVIRIDDTFEEHLLQSPLPGSISIFPCGFICTNRGLVATAAALLFMITGVIVWRALYSGAAHEFAYDYKAAWITGGLLLLILFAMNLCDPFGVFPKIIMILILLGGATAFGYHSYQAIKNGPKP